jgi:hypothetical protein
MSFEGLDSQGLRSGGRRGVGKRGTLKEVSSSGLKGINMSKVDLSWLIGGKSFTVLCTLSWNGCRVTTTALANTRANTFALLDTKCVRKVSEFLNTLLETLERLVSIKGYNRQMGEPITSALRIHLRINRQQLYNMLFLVTDLGHHDVILG